MNSSPPPQHNTNLTTSPTQQGFILTRRQIERRQQTFVELWFKTATGAQRLVTPAQQFVLFIHTENVAQAKQLCELQNIDATSKNLPLKTFEHTPVSALYVNVQQQLYALKDQLLIHDIAFYEDDIRLADRFLMERFIYGSAQFTGHLGRQFQGASLEEGKLKPCEFTPQFRVLSLDIECSERGELYSIGLAAEDFNSVIMIGNQHAPEHQSAPSFITWVEHETALLKTFCQQLNQYDPDLIVGWSVINFDFRLLIKRSELCRVPLQIGRGNTRARWRDSRDTRNNQTAAVNPATITESSQGFITIPGRVVIDGIDALKTATYHFDSFSLEFVSQSLLGKGKKIEDVHDRMAHINHDFRHNKIKLAEYNLEDCRLVLDILDHTKLISFLILRSQLTGLEIDRIGGSVAAFTNLYLPKLHRAGFISPNRPEDGGLASPGGYVMSSRPGLYQHVLVLDFKSLYPSIIRTFKIDPLGLVLGLTDPDNAIPGFRGAHFDRTEHFLPDIITSLWQQRDQAKQDKDAARSQAIKILMNSFYGVLGSGGCRFYDTRLASSITLRGHDIMQSTAKMIEAQGHQVIYGDTDSTFVWLDGDYSVAEAHNVGKELAAHINDQWRKQLQEKYQLDCFLEMEFETYFSQFLMPTIRGAETGSKKRYAGLKAALIQHEDQLITETELVFKGLETVRSDWTELAKAFQQTLYAKVFEQAPVTEYIRQVVQDTRSGKLDHQLVYRKRLRQKLDHYVKNVPPHVKAARLADEHNLRLGRALQYQNKGWINYVFTLNGAEPKEYLTSPIDYDHYVEKQLRPVADAILPFIGLNFAEVTSQQLGLF